MWTLEPHKHALIVLKDHEAVLEDPNIKAHLAFFKCKLCDRHFYIRKEDMRKHLTGDVSNPFLHHRSMFMKDSDGELRLIFTVVT